MDETKHPYGIDIALVFFAVMIGPAAIATAVGLTIVRRSPLALRLILDLVAQLAGDFEMPDTPTLRMALPGLVPVYECARALPAPHSASQPMADKVPHTAAAPIVINSDDDLSATHVRTSLPFIALDTLATSRNILLVGSPGSGKTTLLRALLAQRTHPVLVFDPHAAPGDWPEAHKVIGAGRGFAAIYQQLLNAQALLDKRSKERAAGRTSFPAMTLAGDEWGSVCSEIDAKRDADAPGRVLLRLLKEGRKFGLNAVLSAHGDTAASVGSSGDTMAFRLSFDWIVYCGGYVARYAGDVSSFPTGRTPEGNSFPLVVVAVNPATDDRVLLDMRGLDTSTTKTPEPAKTDMVSDEIDTSTKAVLADTDAEYQPSTSTAPVASGTGMDTELIDALVKAGWGANKIYEKVKGNRPKVLAYIRSLKATESEQEPDVGPFKSYLDKEEDV